jgi:hypothetical protein
VLGRLHRPSYPVCTLSPSVRNRRRGCWKGVELDPDIEEHSPSDPNDALGAPSPEMTKSSKKRRKG